MIVIISPNLVRRTSPITLTGVGLAMLTTITRLAKPSSPSHPSPGDKPSVLPDEVKALAVVLREEFDAPFRFYELATGGRVDLPGLEDTWESIAASEIEAVRELGREERPRVLAQPEGRYVVGFPLSALGMPGLLGLGVVHGLARTPAESQFERARLEKWCRSVHDRLVAARGIHDSRRSQAEQDRQSMVAWEAMMALERLNRGMAIHKEPARERRRILRAAAELLGVQSMVWVPIHRQDEVVMEGEPFFSAWDCTQLADVLANDAHWEEAGFILVDDPGQTGWHARFPRIRNLLAIPVVERKLVGWVLALNKQAGQTRGPGGREKGHHRGNGHAAGGFDLSSHGSFRRSDVATLMPFASLLGLQVRGTRRYLQIKDLLVGLTRALTAAIDAKDAYTYGHSERVARSAVEIGRALGLQEDELSDLYLAGLLHDIGKIGIRDDVLTKRGPLTDEEFLHIQEHVVIGHRILSGLRAIEHLLPGVLYHHERYDGKGYPEGLAGDAIPFLARILAVADSFDAMSTSRPYRNAMSRDRVEEILRQGSGTQWDALIIDAFFRCSDRVHQIRDRGVGESLRHALDGAMRHGQQTHGLASVEVSVS